MKYRAFLIGFAPPGWYDAAGNIADPDKARRLISGSDCCALATAAQRGIAIGQRIDAAILSTGPNGALPPAGRTLVCIAHEHGGKIAVLSDESENVA